MWHVLPDDTGESAVWVCQRVPEGHVSAVANGFVIKEVDLADAENFMGSDNMYEVAERAGLWQPGQHFKFDAVYGMKRGHLNTYVNRRVWRVLDMVAPSLKLPAWTDQFAADYPFSVKAERELTIADVAEIQRDYYQGTDFDTSKGLAGGPFGNPARYDPAPQTDHGGATHEDLLQGRFERTISLFRTSYSFVTQTRNIDDALGLTWFGQYTPHSTVYIPVYTHVMAVPKSLSTGSLFKVDERANWWAFASVGQWCAQWFIYTQPTIEKMQAKLENAWYEAQEEVEALALSIGGFGGDIAVRGYLTDYSEEQAKKALDAWWDLFDVVRATFRDGYHVTDFSTETFNPTSLFFPKWWLVKVGFWGDQCEGGSTVDEAIERNKGEYAQEIVWDDKDLEKKAAEKAKEEKKAEKEEEMKEEKEAEKKEEKKKDGKKEEKKEKEPEIMGAASPIPTESAGHSSSIVATAMVFGGVVGAAMVSYVTKRKERGYQTIPV
jgi:dipeptidase